jgi:hypothetical protein
MTYLLYEYLTLFLALCARQLRCLLGIWAANLA